MDEFLLISLGQTPRAPVHWLVWNRSDGQTLERGQLESAAELNQLSERALAHPCYLLVPQERVLVDQVQLPNGSRAALETVPFQLEEALCEDPEQLHFAIGRPEPDHRYPVAVVDRVWMGQWRDLLLSAPLPIRGMFADAQAINAADEALLAIPQEERVLIKGGGCQGLALARSELAGWRPLLEARAGTALEEMPAGESPLEALAPHFSPEGAINLLQGDFKLRDPVRELLKGWRIPAVLVLVLVLLSLGTLGLETHRLSQHKEALSQQVEDLYREAFPDATRIVNPRVQMERRLEQLRLGSRGAPLLRALDKSAAAFEQHGAISLQALRYDGNAGTLVLELESPSHPLLQQFNAALAAQGLDSQLGQFSSGQQRTRGQVSIEGVQ